MILFGPSGTSNEVAEQKMTRRQQSSYLRDLGLFAYEHPFTFGVKISKETEKDLVEHFSNQNIKLSIHAPYYINFASSDPEKLQNTYKYLLDSVLKAREVGADRVIFHPGSLTGQTREQAVINTINTCVIDYVKDTAEYELFK